MLAKARGQTVYWNAWGGDERTNSFIAWVGDEVQRALRRRVEAGEAYRHRRSGGARRRREERRTRRRRLGRHDLDQRAEFPLDEGEGSALRAVRRQAAQRAFTSTRPTNPRTSPISPFPSTAWNRPGGSRNSSSSTIPRACPRRRARSMHLARWIKAHPGRFTHPDPKDFMGASFLKQVLVDLAPHPERLAAPASDADFAAETAPLWAWYDALRPSFWRHGEQFPADGPAQMPVVERRRGRFRACRSIPPRRPPRSKRAGCRRACGSPPWRAARSATPASSRSPIIRRTRRARWSWRISCIDPATQAHAQDIHALGAFTVLDLSKLSPAQQKLFADLPSNPALPTSAELGKVLLEPHPSWMTRITAEWRKRYAQ